MSKEYKHKFYKDRHRKTVYSANTILAIVWDILPEVRSAVDFGCGVGTWLSVLKEKGVDDIQGIDGPWVEETLLEIPGQCFRRVNFKDEIELDRRYDLAVSLEVAEHLPPEVAGRFVASLAGASDFVLFSAAIPMQGGKGHVNEQWPEYWVDLFQQKDYVVLDIIRNKIWNDDAIPTWYRQNTLLFVKREKIAKLNLPDACAHGRNFPVSIVHPATYLAKCVKVNQAATVKGSLKFFLRAVKKSITTKANK